MSDVRVVSFNVNQFSPVAHQLADLSERMAEADVLLLEETVKLDLTAFAATQPGWSAFQVRNGTNDGHANTAVLYRTALGPVQDTVDLFVGATKGTRRRFLAAVKLVGVWYWALHLFPGRFRAGIPAQLRRTGAWLRTHPGTHVGGLDKNEAKVSDLERATGLSWHGIGIDGFLTNAPLKGLAEFPKGFSDHRGVHAVASTPPPPKVKPVPQPQQTPLQRILAALRVALAKFKVEGKAGKARRAQAAIDALNPKPVVKPKPPKPPVVPPAPHGWMPGAVREPVAFGSSDPTIIPVSVAQHIAVSNATSLQHLFENDGGIESHFYILKDGTIKQHRSIFVQADAQFDGNGFGSPLKGVVSVEHQGGVGSDLNQPMPKAQLDAFHRVILFVRDESPVGNLLMRVCPAWNQPGVGYHAMFEEWNHSHHSCPGAARIQQFNTVTVPWLKAGGK